MPGERGPFLGALRHGVSRFWVAFFSFKQLEHLLDGDDEDAEGEVEEDFPVSPHVDGPPAVAVFEMAVYALHGGAVLEARGAVGFEFWRVSCAETPWIRGDYRHGSDGAAVFADLGRVVSGVREVVEGRADLGGLLMRGIATWLSWRLADVSHMATGMSPSDAATWSL